MLNILLLLFVFNLSGCSCFGSHHVKFEVSSIVTFKKDSFFLTCEPIIDDNVEIYYVKIMKILPSGVALDIKVKTITTTGGQFRNVWLNRDVEERAKNAPQYQNNPTVTVQIPAEQVTYSDSGKYKCEVSQLENLEEKMYYEIQLVEVKSSSLIYSSTLLSTIMSSSSDEPNYITSESTDFIDLLGTTIVHSSNSNKITTTSVLIQQSNGRANETSTNASVTYQTEKTPSLTANETTTSIIKESSEGLIPKINTTTPLISQLTSSFTKSPTLLNALTFFSTTSRDNKSSSSKMTRKTTITTTTRSASTAQTLTQNALHRSTSSKQSSVMLLTIIAAVCVTVVFPIY